MKTTLPTPSPVPTKTIKKDPLQRLSLAVKKLDQLINRAHQLGSFTDQLLREDKTGQSIPSSEANHTQPGSSSSSTKLKTSRKLSEKYEEP